MQQSELTEDELQLVAGGMPASLGKAPPSSSRGLILVVGVVQPMFNLSIVIIANTIINAPLTININQGLRRS